MARALVSVPATAKRGDILEIKTLVRHVMEPVGLTADLDAVVVPEADFPMTQDGNGDLVHQTSLRAPASSEAMNFGSARNMERSVTGPVCTGNRQPV